MRQALALQYPLTPAPSHPSTPFLAVIIQDCPKHCYLINLSNHQPVELLCMQPHSPQKSCKPRGTQRMGGFTPICMSPIQPKVNLLLEPSVSTHGSQLWEQTQTNPESQWNCNTWLLLPNNVHTDKPPVVENQTEGFVSMFNDNPESDRKSPHSWIYQHLGPQNEYLFSPFPEAWVATLNLGTVATFLSNSRQRRSN